MTLIEPTKRCRRCDAHKPMSAFPRRSDSRDGVGSWCSACTSEGIRATKAKKRDHYLRVQRVATARWRAARPDYSRERRLAKLGLSLAGREALLEAQGGVCAICGGGSNDRNLHVDHSHATGRVRGVLCGKCNRALGYLDDDPVRMLACAEYVRKEQDDGDAGG